MPKGVYNRGAKKTEKTEKVQKAEDVAAAPKRRGRPPKALTIAKALPELRKAIEPTEEPKKHTSDNLNPKAIGAFDARIAFFEMEGLNQAVNALVNIRQATNTGNSALAGQADAILSKIMTRLDGKLFPVEQVADKEVVEQEDEKAAEPEPVKEEVATPITQSAPTFTPVAQPTVPVSFNPPTVQ